MPFAPVLELSLLVYLSVVLVEFWRRRDLGRLLFETATAATVVSLAVLVNAAATGRVSFGGGSSPVTLLGTLTGSSILGIVCRYVFYLTAGQFSWLDFLKPLAITPISILPLWGSLQGTGELNQMQLITFGLLAFQNGFFWQVVLTGAKPVTQGTLSAKGRRAAS